MCTDCQRKKNLTYHQISELIFLYENNISIGDLAKHFNKNLSTIHRTILKTKPKRKTIQDILEEKVCAQIAK